MGAPVKLADTELTRVADIGVISPAESLGREVLAAALAVGVGGNQRMVCEFEITTVNNGNHRVQVEVSIPSRIQPKQEG